MSVTTKLLTNAYCVRKSGQALSSLVLLRPEEHLLT